MGEEDVAALVTVSASDCRYLTNFTGEATSVIVTRDEVALVTDSRFTVQAGEEVMGARVLLAENGPEGPVIEFLRDVLTVPQEEHLTFAVDTERLSLKHWERLRSALDEVPLEWKTVDGLVGKARVKKFPDEVAAVSAAAALADSAFAYLETISVVGRTELDVALDLEVFLRRNGSEGIPFPFIVAAGPRAAMPHGEASSAFIQNGQLVVFDIGAVIDGYASDITRTYATGPLDEELTSAYEAVRSSQEIAVARARSGMSCKDLDKLARDHLAEAGLDDLFVHSLGHGVGLEVHEAPGVGPRSTETLGEGMIITVEPGVYLPGKGGVRIEDTVLITASGAQSLTHSPRELRFLH